MMRFAQLHLIRYGRFEDRRLDFPRQATDLHIVYGPNEAGKSTTLSAVNDLLFGFPHISPFDFRFDTKLLRVGAVIEGEAGEQVYIRKKGRTGTLMGPDERVIDDGVLAAGLAGYTADGFTRMFSLDHRRLREGGRAILTASDDVGQAIFAAGSGLMGVTRVLEQLEEEARAIWTRRAGDRRYYQAQKAYEEARARQKAAQIRPAAWDDLHRQIARFNEETDALERIRAEATLERDRVERCRRVLPHAVLYRKSEAELAALGDTPEFPVEAATTLEEVDAAVAVARLESRRAEADGVALRESLDRIVIDPRMMECGGAIEALRETKGAVDKTLGDLPRRRTELRTLQATLEAHQRELGWPLEDAAGARARLPRRVRVAGVRDLLERRRALEATRAAAVGETAAARERVTHLAGELADLPPGRELAEITDSVRFASGLGDIEAVVRRATKELDRHETRLAADIAGLAPWDGDVDALGQLVLPSEAETTAALGVAADARTTLAEAKRALENASRRADDLALQRAQLLRAGPAVPLAALAEARMDRDGAWHAVKAHLLAAAPLSDLPSAVDRVEAGMGTADVLADQRFASAEQSAMLATLEDEIERNSLAIEQAMAMVGNAERAVATCSAQWRRLLTGAGLALSPEAFTAWRGRSARALESARSCSDACDVLDDARARLEQGRERLLAALAGSADAIDAATPFSRLLDRAQRLESAGLAEAADRNRLEVELKAAKLALARAEETEAKVRADLDSWDVEWAGAIEAAALDADTAHSVVRTQLELIDTMRALVEEILSLEQRIRDMERDVADFADQVRAVARACGVDPYDKTAPALVDELARAVTEATRLATQRAALEAQLQEADRRLADARAVEDRALARLEPLRLVVGTDDRAEMVRAIQASDRARALGRDMARHAEDIVKAGEGPALEALLVEADRADAEALPAMSRRLTDDITTLSDRIATLSADCATAGAEFKRLDAGPDAAVAAADAEQAKAEMAVLAEAYARKRAEIGLLRWAIAKYRLEKQNPLLRRASCIFSRLTLGRYEELLIDLESDRARLAAVTLDKTVVPVEGMSEGTVDQLFLALRLAAVEETVDNGSRLPFLADDLFINFDDARSAAGLQVLAELARRTQVLFFTHHRHLLDLACQVLAPTGVHSVTLT